MKLTRKIALKEMLTNRLAHRQGLLQVKCVDSLTQQSGLAEEMAERMTARWNELVMMLQDAENDAWETAAKEYGAWCAAEQIPFAAIMAQIYYYKQAAMPILVREYQGVEGYLEGHLALDEALALLAGKIPPGYFEA